VPIRALAPDATADDARQRDLAVYVGERRIILPALKMFASVDFDADKLHHMGVRSHAVEGCRQAHLSYWPGDEDDEQIDSFLGKLTILYRQLAKIELTEEVAKLSKLGQPLAVVPDIVEDEEDWPEIEEALAAAGIHQAA